jgi:hypothetical protein
MTVINFPGSGGHNGGQSLIVRAVALKQRLVAFVLTGPLRAELDRINHGVSLDPPFTAASVDLIDWFLFEWEGADGVQALDEFLEHAADLEADDRRLIEGWYEAIDDIFEVTGRSGDGFVLRDEDGVDYVVVPTMMRAEELRWEAGTHVSTRILPVEGLYILSGVQSVGDTREELEDAALDRLDAQIEEMMRVIWSVLSAAFGEFFGGDEVDLPAGEVVRRLSEFREFALERHRLEGVGRTLGDVLRETFGHVPPIDLMHENTAMLDALDPTLETSLLAEADAGVAVAPGYPLLRRFVGRGEGDPEALRGIVLDLLESETVPPFVLQRLASIDASRLETLLAHALDDPGFDIEADFDELIAEYKPDFFDDEDDEEGADADWLGELADDVDELEGLVTPDDLDDVRERAASECPPGSLVEAARAFLAETEGMSKGAAARSRAEGVNLLLRFADEEGIDEVEALTSEALRRFAGAWYTRAWSERGRDNATAMLSTLEAFGEWLERSRGWTGGEQFVRSMLPGFKADLPRTVEATVLLAAASADDDESVDDDAWSEIGDESLEGIFVIIGVRDRRIDAELRMGLDDDGAEVAPGSPLGFDLDPAVTSHLRPGDYFSGCLTRFGDEWKVVYLNGFFAAATME